MRLRIQISPWLLLFCAIAGHVHCFMFLWFLFCGWVLFSKYVMDIARVQEQLQPQIPQIPADSCIIMQFSGKKGETLFWANYIWAQGPPWGQNSAGPPDQNPGSAPAFTRRRVTSNFGIIPEVRECLHEPLWHFPTDLSRILRSQINRKMQIKKVVSCLCVAVCFGFSVVIRFLWGLCVCERWDWSKHLNPCAYSTQIPRKWLSLSPFNRAFSCGVNVPCFFLLVLIGRVF